MNNIQSKNGRSKAYIIKYNYAKEMYLKGDKTLTDICKVVGITIDSLSSNLKKDGIEVNATQNRTLNENVFSIINTEEKAYWLGFLYADGCVNSNTNKIEISLKASDYKHLEKFKMFMSLSNNISYKITKLNDKEYKSCKIMFTSKKVKSDLIKLGCVPKKSLILKFPNDNIVPNHLKRHFMRGYIDGDGSLMFTEKTKALNLIGTEDFLIDFCNYFGLKINTLSGVGESKLNKRWQTYDKSRLPNILNMFYKDAKIYLNRKYDIYLMFINNAVLTQLPQES